MCKHHADERLAPLAWKRLHVLKYWSVMRHLAAVAAVAVEILRTPRALAPIFGLSVLTNLLTVLVAWCAARSVSANAPLFYSLFLVPPVVLISIVLISIAGWGVHEVAMLAAFTYAGLPQSDGFIILLLFGAIYLVLGVGSGVVWILSSDRTNRTAVSPPSASIDDH
jgi:glycosyltransferase 2 family protein